jgi:uncharacterized repeat protein (TIGR01451 family)
MTIKDRGGPRALFAWAALAAILGTLPPTLARAGENAWTVSGPPGGFLRDLEASATDANTFYAAYGRTFFRTTDAGTTWQARHFVQEVVDIAVDPTDGNRLYLAALEGGLYRSEDAGRTFTQIAAGNTSVWSVGVGGTDGKTVYYATGNGAFFRSTDRGETFVARPLTFVTITHIRVEGADGLSILALRGSVLARSPDGGATWSEASVDGMNTILSFTRLGNGTLVATTNSGVFRSVDGVMWTRVLNGTFYAAAADPAAPAASIVANVGDGPLWRMTTDGNAVAWSTFGTPPPLGSPLRAIATAGSVTRLVLANAQGVQVSTDGGTTWNEASSGLNASASARMASTVAPGARVYAYTPALISGLFSTTTGDTWQRLNLNGAQSLMPSKPFGQATVAVKPRAPDTVYLGAFDAGMFRSDDGGATWSGPDTGLDGLSANAIAFDPTDANVMYASVWRASLTPSAALYRSSDGGATWSPHSVDLPNAFGRRLAVHPADGSRMFLAAASFAGSSPGLYRSVDAGLHWSHIAFASHDVHDVALDPGDPRRVYAAADRGGLNVSSDGGATFTPNAALAAITTQGVVALALDPVIPTTIYAATADSSLTFRPQSSYVLRSVDRGQTWESLRTANDEPSWFVNDLIMDPNVPSLLYAATGGRGIGAFEIVNDLAVSIGGHAGLKPRGSSSSFHVNVQNNGMLSATAVRLTVQLPEGLTNVGSTPPAGTCTVATNIVRCDIPFVRPAQSIAVLVSYTPPQDMALPVSATVSAHERDPVAANDTGQAAASAGEVAPPTTSGGGGSGSGGSGALDQLMLLVISLSAALRLSAVRRGARASCVLDSSQ